MTIYQVFKNFCASDSDGWQHWIGKHVISFHLTLEGAEQKVDALIANDVLDWDDYRPKALGGKNWFRHHRTIIANRTQFATGENGRGSTTDVIYGVKTIDLEP